MNSISVDVEEYFHAANLEPVAGPARWHALESRVEFSTQKLLDIYAELNAKGTFFVLGATARRHPALVRTIAAQGHEIGSHGYGHRLVREQTPAAFYRDIRKSKLLLEDITGAPVLGYRAPNFSIRENTSWAYELLVKAGFLYDSSLHPVAHPRYGNTHRSTKPEKVETPSGILYELPLSVFALNPGGGYHLNLPCSGGAYWRLFPSSLITAFLRASMTQQGHLICYLHPWEVDPDQPRFEQLSFLTKVRHYTGLDSMPRMVRRVAKLFPSKRMCDILFAIFPDAKTEALTRCHPNRSKSN